MLRKFYTENALQAAQVEATSGQTAWQSPSNIAIVKYWGKHGRQLPNNPSVSFTLSEANTQTRLSWKPRKSNQASLKFLFEGKEQPAFAEKIDKFLFEQASLLPFLERFDLEIASSNSFPHSSGIASSASSMSALALCLLDMEQQLRPEPMTEDAFRKKASWLAREASGSAARSIYPHAALWGHSAAAEESHQEYAVAVRELNDIFKTYRDSILIVHAGTKAVSSRAGHALMEGNPYADARYAQARENTNTLLKVLQNGDLETFIRITETEALQLHALMMTSNPSFILMKPATLSIIEKVRAFRAESKLPLCFTLDAGPNIHLLYPASVHEQVNQFIQSELLQHCEQQRWIDDATGSGPIRI